MSKPQIQTGGVIVLTLAQLLTLCRSFVGVGFASIVASTIPRQVKTDSPWDGMIGKIAHLQINWGAWRYGSALANQAKREGKDLTFDVKPRQWGTRLPNSPLVHHVDKQGEEKYYIAAKIEEVLTPSKYFDASTGVSLTKEEVLPFLRFNKPSTTQEGLEKEVIERDYALTSIVELHALGNVYHIKQEG